jgi:protein SCO1/2
MKALTAIVALLGCAAAAPLAARDSDPPASLYHLQASLTDQDGRAHGIDVHRGHPVLVTMFYSSCPATCPLIVDTLRATERELDAAQRARLRVLMISIDPERDTPAALRELAESRHIDTNRWTLARADAATVRKIAALLNIQYRQLPDGEFNHSTVIALLTPAGEIDASSSTLGQADAALLARLRR